MGEKNEEGMGQMYAPSVYDNGDLQVKLILLYIRSSICSYHSGHLRNT